VTTPGSEKPLLRLPGIEQPEDVSADGTTLAYLEMVSNTAWSIRLLNLAGDPKPQTWLPTRFNQASPRFSPDGRWIAFESDESGSPEVYVASVAGAQEKRRISPAGGRAPRWKRDGRELYYLAPGNLLMSVSAAGTPAWSGTAPAVVFRSDSEIENYDVSPDGSRFLVATPVEKVRESPLRVILNWPALMMETS